MDEYMEEVFEYDNSEPEDARWNEGYEEYEWVAEDEETAPEDDTESRVLIDEVIEALNRAQNYGSMGDYYNMTLGCYVFPNFEVYEYFIDIDAVGHEWAETSDGHYVPLLYLEAYEGYRSGNGEEEEPEGPADVLPSEMETQTLETLESVRGLLSVIKENNTAFYDGMQEYQAESLETGQRALAYAEGTLYANITECVLLAVIAGIILADAFFSRFRGG